MRSGDRVWDHDSGFFDLMIDVSRSVDASMARRRPLRASSRSTKRGKLPCPASSVTTQSSRENPRQDARIEPAPDNSGILLPRMGPLEDAARLIDSPVS